MISSHIFNESHRSVTICKNRVLKKIRRLRQSVQVTIGKIFQNSTHHNWICDDFSKHFLLRQRKQALLHGNGVPLEAISTFLRREQFFLRFQWREIGIKNIIGFFVKRWLSINGDLRKVFDETARVCFLWTVRSRTDLFFRCVRCRFELEINVFRYFIEKWTVIKSIWFQDIIEITWKDNIRNLNCILR